MVWFLQQKGSKFHLFTNFQNCNPNHSPIVWSVKSDRGWDECRLLRPVWPLCRPVHRKLPALSPAVQDSSLWGSSQDERPKLRGIQNVPHLWPSGEDFKIPFDCRHPDSVHAPRGDSGSLQKSALGSSPGWRGLYPSAENMHVWQINTCPWDVTMSLRSKLETVSNQEGCLF